MYVVTVIKSGSERLKPELVHGGGAKDDRKELVEGYVLRHGTDDLPCFLVQGLPIPRERIIELMLLASSAMLHEPVLERLFDPVVLSHPDRMHHRQDALLVHSIVS